MKTAVIYARYSSERQNEQSIEGQLADCRAWAKSNDINIIDTYCDEALTGRTDKRPAFQRMIHDARSERFDYILVWKIDRFARNRYDSAIYKAQLKKYGVKVLSVKENIADGPEGIILESVLEGMAEYYSANLSQNVLRGMRQNAQQGKSLGSTPPLGYSINKEKKYIINEKQAALVRKIFDLYTSGSTMKEICTTLNASGYKTATGKPFTYDTIRRTLTNSKYIGCYKSMGITLADAVPSIVSYETFEAAQAKINSNKRAPAKSKSPIDFTLTGKLFCAHCGGNMVGDSGTSSTKAPHYYYSCLNRKRKKSCTKKSVRKEYIENLITKITLGQVLTPEAIKSISQQAYDLHLKEINDTSELTALEHNLSDTQRIINNIMSAIEQGIITETTKQRLTEAEERKKLLQESIAIEKIKKPLIPQEHIEFFLTGIRDSVINSENATDAIIKTFVNSVHLHDDHITITYNYSENNHPKKIHINDISKFGFNDNSCTITILSELSLFAVTKKLRT